MNICLITWVSLSTFLDMSWPGMGENNHIFSGSFISGLLLTIRQCKGRQQGKKTSEFSMFPIYSWRVSYSDSCRQNEHLRK